MFRVKIEPESEGESSSFSSPSPSPSPHQAGQKEQAIALFESKVIGARYDERPATPSSDDTEPYYVNGEGESSTSNDDIESWLSPGESSPNDGITVNFKSEIEKIIHHHYRKPGFKTFFKVKWKGYCITTWEGLDSMCLYRDDSALKKYVRRLSDASKGTLLQRAPILAKYLRTKKSSRKGNNSSANE